MKKNRWRQGAASVAAAAVLLGCFGVPVARGFAALAQTVVGA